MDIAYEKKLEKLGAFEISSSMLKLAKNNDRHNACLNAGRGNPNWINTQSRLAFARFMTFAVRESQRDFSKGTMAGIPVQEGIYDRLMDDLGEDDTDRFLRKAFTYAVQELSLPKDEFVKEMADAVIGNNYPVPSRCLSHIEAVLAAYVESTLFDAVSFEHNMKIFPTEGGTAAMCYIFDALSHNGLLQPGDKVAINTPIFTPYIQIPHLTGYSMVEIDLQSTPENDWHIPPEEIDKLRDPSIKAFFLVNPSNPGSHALKKEMLEHIREVVHARPDLMIITDDVYGTFVDHFQTVYTVAPRNTLLVYSFSKLYGVTGWRTGLIAMNEDNVFDALIKKLPAKKKEELRHDYSIVTLDPDHFPFVERICADSRNIGLYHTSGLSTPQQGFMAIMALTHLVCKKDDSYIRLSKEIVSSRYSDLFSTLGMPEDNDPTNAKYYSLIDVYRIAEKVYDAHFAAWLKDSFEEIDFLMRLAKEEGVVLMEGVGFSATPGTLRVSQANLPDKAYKMIAGRILETLAEYHTQYEKRS